MTDPVKRGALGVLVFLVLVSTLVVASAGQGTTAYQSLVPTGMYSALPFKCYINLNIEGASAITLFPGSTGEVAVRVEDVTCGVTNARIELLDVPDYLYTVTPSQHGAIAPVVGAEYTIHFTVPESEETVNYQGTYILKTEESTFTGGTIDIAIKDAIEKPAIKPVVLGPTVSVESETRVQPSLSTWFFIGLFSTMAAIILVSHLYFAEPVKKVYHSKSKKNLKEALKG